MNPSAPCRITTEVMKCFGVNLSDSFSREIEKFQSEISKLKCEKLDLARQNLVSGVMFVFRW